MQVNFFAASQRAADIGSKRACLAFAKLLIQGGARAWGSRFVGEVTARRNLGMPLLRSELGERQARLGSMILVAGRPHRPPFPHNPTELALGAAPHLVWKI